MPRKNSDERVEEAEMDAVDAEVGDDAVGSVIIVGEGTVVVIVDVVVINIANTDHGEKKRCNLFKSHDCNKDAITIIQLCSETEKNYMKKALNP